MRLGGPFPFGQSLRPVDLAAGAVYYPPAGNYLYVPGIVTVLQFFDPQTLNWRSLSPDFFGALMPFATDGFNWRIVNFSGIVQGALVTNVGSGATTNGIGTTATGVSVTFASPSSPGRTALAYPIIGGKLNTSVTVTQAGSGFLSAPRITVDPPPPGGIRAQLRATMTAAGAISSITVDNPGAGYLANPNIYITPQPQFYQRSAVAGQAAGTVPPPGLIHPSMQPPEEVGGYATSVANGALLTLGAIAGSGTLTGIGMLDYGSFYTGTTIPAVSFTGGSLAGGVAATAIMSMSMTSVTLGTGGATYGSPGPIWLSSTGNIVTTAGRYEDGLANDMVPRPARGTTVVAAGVVTSYVIEDPGFGFQSVPVVAAMSVTATVATANSIGTAVCGGISDTFFLMNAVQ